MSELAAIGLEGLSRVAEGIARPEDVLVTPTGRIFASDASAAVSEIHADGSRTPIGDAGGEPNGLAMLGDDLVIANFALGIVQLLELTSGRVATLARWGLADGCAVDAESNVWVTLMAANRIVAITPALDVVTVLDDPDGAIVVAPTSIAWGGSDRRDLYIGSLVSGYVVKGWSP